MSVFHKFVTGSHPSLLYKQLLTKNLIIKVQVSDKLSGLTPFTGHLLVEGLMVISKSQDPLVIKKCS